MKLKEAIYFLQTCKRGDIDFQKIAELITALRASQKREREVFKALSGHCQHAYSLGCVYDGVSYKCTLRNCPLLKKGVKG